MSQFKDTTQSVKTAQNETIYTANQNTDKKEEHRVKSQVDEAYSTKSQIKTFVSLGTVLGLVACGGGSEEGSAGASAPMAMDATASATGSEVALSSAPPLGSSMQSRTQGQQGLVSPEERAYALSAQGIARPAAPFPVGNSVVLETAAQAARFLSFSSLGFSDSDKKRLIGQSIEGYLKEQMNLPLSFSFLGYYHKRVAYWRTVNPFFTPYHMNVQEVFWGWNLDPSHIDSLRQRISFALSQHFVVSMSDTTLGENPQAVVSFYELLARHSFGSFFDLLKAITLHPAMGIFLTFIQNVKENPQAGTIPDQNYAREIMQLFTIGTRNLTIQGRASRQEVYTEADVQNLSRVFTGLSYGGPDTSDSRFLGHLVYENPQLYEIPMQAYERYHSTSKKIVLGTQINPSDTMGEIDQALTILMTHPNCAPFFAKCMIQRLITSNPPPAYVERVALAFKNANYSLSVLWYSIFSDPFVWSKDQLSPKRFEDGLSSVDRYTVRAKDPIERFCHLAKSIGIQAPSGYFYLGETADPATSLGQAIFRAPSVFNFTRPGYIPKGTAISDLGGVAPELQIRNEVSIYGYVQAAKTLIDYTPAAANFAAFTDWVGLAGDPQALVSAMSGQILTERPLDTGSALKIISAINQIPIPTGPAKSRSALLEQQNAARLQRCKLCALLLSITPQSELTW